MVSAKEQVRFLRNIQRLLAEGQFTATYKFALILALADIAVEQGNDSADELEVSTRLIAEKFVQYYWRHIGVYGEPKKRTLVGMEGNIEQ